MTSQHNENKNGVDQAEHEKLVRRWENLRETYRSVKEAEAQQREHAGELEEEVSRLEGLNKDLSAEHETARAERAKLQAVIDELRAAESAEKGDADESARVEAERAALAERLKEVQEGSAKRISEIKSELSSYKSGWASKEASMNQEMEALRE